MSTPTPKVMKPTRGLATALLFCGAAGLGAQAPQAAPAPMAADAPLVFEVATIKPSQPDTPGKGLTFRGRAFTTLNTTVNDLLSFMLEVHPDQITNGPAWLATEKFDITAQPEAPGVPNLPQLRAMVLKLLEDRFKLARHSEKKELSVYVLSVSKTGPKLTKSERGANALPGMFFKSLGQLPAVNASMADLSGLLQGTVLDRPVVDRTGLVGRFDFTLNWTPDDSQFRSMGIRVPPPSGDPNAPPGLFTAIQEQLGLRLEAARAPVDVVVIDRIERPSEN
jgi:uncharacterized protein (TIGR03435 family)